MPSPHFPRPTVRSAIPAAAFLLGAPAAARAEASLEVLHALGSGFGRFSVMGFILFGAFVVLLMAFLVFLEIMRAGKSQRERIEIGWHYFNEMAAAKRLTAPEAEILRRIVEAGGLGSADMVFDSSFIYEDALEAFLASHLRQFERDPSQYALLRGLRLKLGYSHLPAEIPLSSTRQLDEGTPIALADGEGSVCKGRVSEVRENLWIATLESDIPPTVAAGAAASLSLLRAGDGEYAVKTTVLGTRVGQRSVHFPHTRGLERKQLRNWVRIDVNIPCRVTVMTRPEGWSAGQGGPAPGMVLEGRMLDLSGGGTCARFSSPIPQGSRLSLNFDLPGTSLRGVHCEVMRMTSVIRSNREDFEHNLKFMEMETAFQEKIVRYVFEKQRIDSQMRGPIKAE